ncbi:hypothetical protein EVAR_97886_1 [Eumeta japonica]|uniref:RNA-directed DNA polymerase from mobile element jockey n=1 Tax=Eumeta variegata TaxID=151549 RepID=A0A4C1WGW0_EUMVA|nr:hypothetical protein EVAR_97886_1 [Eumeta japonica]
MPMLHWIASVTLLEKIKNQYIRRSFRVAPIVNKVKEKLLRWYGLVQRCQEDHLVKLAQNLSIAKCSRGRPPATWLTTIDKDLQKNHLDKT